MLIQKAPLPLVHSHSVSYGRFKRRLVDFLPIEYWTPTVGHRELKVREICESIFRVIMIFFS